MNLNEEEEVFGSTRNTCVGLRKQRSCWNSTHAAHLSRFANSVAAGGGSRLDMSGGGDSSVRSLWPNDRFGTRYSHSHVGPAGESNPLLDGSKSSHKKDFHSFLRRPAMVRNLFTDQYIYIWSVCVCVTIKWKNARL